MTDERKELNESAATEAADTGVALEGEESNDVDALRAGGVDVGPGSRADASQECSAKGCAFSGVDGDEFGGKDVRKNLAPQVALRTTA